MSPFEKFDTLFQTKLAPIRDLGVLDPRSQRYFASHAIEETPEEIDFKPDFSTYIADNNQSTQSQSNFENQQ